MSNKRKVLVAEDDPAIPKYLEMCLTRLGYTVFVEHTGAAALQRARVLQPNVALLGVVMPEMGGVEAGIHLLKVSPNTKIVLITEVVPPGVLSDLRTKGYRFTLLPAPFTQEELRRSIGDLDNE